MSILFSTLSSFDLYAIVLFFVLWLAFNVISDRTPVRKYGLSYAMEIKRKEWVCELMGRELRMVDTQIMIGLQQGAAFFASTSIFAIGGCIALLGSADEVLRVYGDLPLNAEITRAAFEVKMLGLALIFTYTFFKFGWAYRLFNYCSILIGSCPPAGLCADQYAQSIFQTTQMNVIASRHFTAGLRASFFTLGYMGWFIGPRTLIITTLFVLFVLIRRQYFSRAKKVLAPTLP